MEVKGDRDVVPLSGDDIDASCWCAGTTYLTRRRHDIVVVVDTDDAATNNKIRTS